MSWTEAEVAASLAEPAELLNLEDLRVSRPPAAAIADASLLSFPAKPPEVAKLADPHGSEVQALQARPLLQPFI